MTVSHQILQAALTTANPISLVGVVHITGILSAKRETVDELKTRLERGGSADIQTVSRRFPRRRRGGLLPVNDETLPLIRYDASQAALRREIELRDLQTLVQKLRWKKPLIAAFAVTLPLPFVSSLFHHLSSSTTGNPLAGIAGDSLAVGLAHCVGMAGAFIGGMVGGQIGSSINTKRGPRRWGDSDIVVGASIFRIAATLATSYFLTTLLG